MRIRLMSSTRVPKAASPRSAAALWPRKTPAQERSRDTFALILKAAAQVFAAQGYAGATTNHIAERAGVSIGSLYEYFPNKEAILVALEEAHLDEGQQILRQTALELAATPTNLEGTVRRFVMAMVQVHAVDPTLHRVLSEEAPRPPRLQRRILEVEQESVAWTEQYLRSQNEIVVRAPGVAAAMVVQTVEAMTHKVVIHPEPSTNVDAYIEEIVALVMGYLTARP